MVKAVQYRQSAEGLIETIVNSTFTDNSCTDWQWNIRNHGIINISFSTIANNKPPPPPTPPPFVETLDLKNIEMEQGGIVIVGNGVTRVRNSILASNIPDNCFGFLNDFGGNYSDDFSCGLTGDGSEYNTRWRTCKHWWSYRNYRFIWRRPC